jgi:hypothetical protein
VAIVGQQARTSLGGNYQQEVDLVSLFKDVAGDYVHMATLPSQMRHLVDRAVRIAKAERTVTCLIMPNDFASIGSTAGSHVLAPYWVKLVRAGNVFYGYQSTNGSNWTLVGSQTISMTGTIYVGVGTTSDVTGTLTLGLLDRVAIIPTGNYLVTGDISAGDNHNLYLQPNGSVWAWGKNTNGQVGDGTTTTRKSPVQLTTLTGMEAVSAGTAYSLALGNDGTVWAWGLNTNGQLGDGTTTEQTSPEHLSSLSGIVNSPTTASGTIGVAFN